MSSKLRMVSAFVVVSRSSTVTCDFTRADGYFASYFADDVAANAEARRAVLAEQEEAFGVFHEWAISFAVFGIEPCLSGYTAFG